jgi:hypothetical protein
MLRFRGGDTNKSRKRRKDADRRNLNDISTGHQSQFAFGNVNTGRGMVPFLTHTGNPVIHGGTTINVGSIEGGFNFGSTINTNSMNTNSMNTSTITEVAARGSYESSGRISRNFEAHAAQVVDLCDNDDEFASNFHDLVDKREFDGGMRESASERILNRRSTYQPEEKAKYLALVDKYMEKNHVSRCIAIQHVRESVIKAGQKPPGETSLLEWQNKRDKGTLEIDGRAHSPEFEKAVMNKLFQIEMNKVWAESNDEPEKIVTAMKSIVYSATMCKIAAEEVSKLHPFNKDPRVTRIEKFESTWAQHFLARQAMVKHKVHAKAKDSIRPSKESIYAQMETIQNTIIESGLSADNIFSADETGVFMNAQFTHKYVKKSSGEKATDDADEKKRITDMAAISISGESIAPYMIIQCSSKRADLSGTTVLNSLLNDLRERDGEQQWTHHVWEKEVTFPNKKTNSVEKTLFKRPYLLHSSGAVVTCQHKAWMDRVGSRESPGQKAMEERV